MIDLLAVFPCSEIYIVISYNSMPFRWYWGVQNTNYNIEVNARCSVSVRIFSQIAYNQQSNTNNNIKKYEFLVIKFIKFHGPWNSMELQNVPWNSVIFFSGKCEVSCYANVVRSYLLTLIHIYTLYRFSIPFLQKHWNMGPSAKLLAYIRRQHWLRKWLVTCWVPIYCQHETWFALN